MSRLSAFLAAVGAAMGMLVFASPASAVPLAPKLIHTDPTSSKAAPASSTAPRVFGEAEPDEGGVTRVLGASSRLLGAVTSAGTSHPNFEIEIFGSSNCQGTAIKVGTAGDLEGTGIPVLVSENALTVLSARQIDPAEPAFPSPCSNDLPYWEGAVASEEPDPPLAEEPAGPPPGGGGSSPSPAPGGGGAAGSASSATPSVGNSQAVSSTPPGPPKLRTVPGGVSSNASPLVAGSAPGAGAVKIFTDPQCEGPPVASGSAAQLGAGFPVTVVENSVVSFYGVAFNSAGRSRCSEPVQYIEDSLAPLVRITMGPAAKTRKRSAVFRFVDVNGADQPGTSYYCRVGKAKSKWKACSSPLRLKKLKRKQYLVSIKATDAAGNVDKKPTTRKFKVVGGA